MDFPRWIWKTRLVALIPIEVLPVAGHCSYQYQYQNSHILDIILLNIQPIQHFTYINTCMWVYNHVHIHIHTLGGELHICGYSKIYMMPMLLSSLLDRTRGNNIQYIWEIGPLLTPFPLLFTRTSDTLAQHSMLWSLRFSSLNWSHRLSLSISNLLLDFLTNWRQSVCIHDFKLSPIIPNSGSPKGCVLSPLLFSLSCDCSATHPSCYIVKFADNLTAVGLISHDERQEPELSECCAETTISTSIWIGLKKVGGGLQEGHKPPTSHLRDDFFPPAFTPVFSSFKQTWRPCRVVKSAQGITGSSLPTVGDTCNSRSRKQTSCIIRDSTNPGPYLFAPCPQERGCTVSGQGPPGWEKPAT